MAPDVSRTLSPGDRAVRLVSEGDAEARAALYILHKGSVGLEFVEALKAEVDPIKTRTARSRSWRVNAP